MQIFGQSISLSLLFFFAYFFIFFGAIICTIQNKALPLPCNQNNRAGGNSINTATQL
jgi:hypothetical protein